MSENKYSLQISLEAYDDLIDIQSYTFQTYGELQMHSYSHELDRALMHIINYPLSGHRRDDIPKGYLAWPVKEHIMIYRIEAEVIFLVRVLHGKMDFRFQFS